MCHVSGRFQCREEKEVGIVRESYVVLRVTLEYAELNDRRWINWTAIRRSWWKSVEMNLQTTRGQKHTLSTRATGSCSLWLLDDLQLVREMPAFFRHPTCRSLRLIGDGHDAGHGGRSRGKLMLEYMQ